MYADESGDSGLHKSPTRYFVLSGVVVHEIYWHEMLDRLVAFRRRMRAKFGLLLAEEIHAGKMLSRPGYDAVRIKKNDRLTIIRELINTISRMDFVSIINVRVDKQGKMPGYDPFERAWEALIQRFENTLNHRNFPGPASKDDLGIIFCDETDDATLRRLYRKMRIYNPVPNMRALYNAGYRQLPLARIAEDPNIRLSHHSYFVQAADSAAFAAYQWYAPSGYVRRKGARNYFRRLDPVLCKVASATHPLGVVEL
jgi:hypothetical protein